MGTSAEVVEWQTRTFEGRVGVSPCGFKSRLRHQHPPDCIHFPSSEISLISIRLKAGFELGVLKGVFPLQGVTVQTGVKDNTRTGHIGDTLISEFSVHQSA